MMFSEIKRDPNNISLQSGEENQPSTDAMDFQSYIEEEGSTKQGNALATPFHAMDSRFTNTNVLLSYHVKAEPVESEDKEDYELKSTQDYSYDIHIKQETIEGDVENDYIMRDEVDQVKISANEDDGEDIKNCKNTFPDFTILKSTMDDKLLPAVQDSNNSEQGSVSDTIGDMDNEKHSGRKQNACSICGKVFKTSQACLWHMWRTHTGGESHPCEQCKKTFKCQNDLKCHQISHSNERPYTCNLCEKTFKLKRTLQDHIAECHSNERPYACSLCEKTFARKDSLHQHKVCHSNERPYACDLCEMTFKLKRTLQDHIAGYHSNKRPYACNLCEKTFKLKRTLQTHIAECHSNERPYACNLCEKTFARKSNLRQHKVCHSDERPYTCDLCEKTFKSKQALWRHKIARHSNEMQSDN